MKKILLILSLVSSVSMATEVFSEYYVMEKILPFLTKAQSYNNQNGEEVKAIKVDWKILKALKTTSDPFYYTNYAQEQKMVRIGDYMISPLTFSEISSANSKEFNSNFIKK